MYLGGGFVLWFGGEMGGGGGGGVALGSFSSLCYKHGTTIHCMANERHSLKTAIPHVYGE